MGLRLVPLHPQLLRLWTLCFEIWGGGGGANLASHGLQPMDAPRLFSALALPRRGDVNRPGSCFGFWSRPRPSSASGGRGSGRAACLVSAGGGALHWLLDKAPSCGWTRFCLSIQPGGHSSWSHVWAAVITCTQACMWTRVHLSGEMDAQQRSHWVVQELGVERSQQPRLFSK